LRRSILLVFLIAVLAGGELTNSEAAFSIVQGPSIEAPNMLWDATFGSGTKDMAYRVIQTFDGGYALIGSLGHGYYPREAMLVKTDATGKLQWNQTFQELNEAFSIVQTSDKGYVIAGKGDNGIEIVKTDLRGQIQWNKNYSVTNKGENDGDISSLIKTSDGGYLVVGSCLQQIPGMTASDGLLIKTDSSGKVLWMKIYGGAGLDYFSWAIETNDGGYALAGRTASFGAGGFDYWLAKTDSSGVLLWSRTYGAGPSGLPTQLSIGFSGDDEAKTVVQTIDGGYILSGDTHSFGSGGSNVWLVKTDALGNMEWNKTYGGDGDESLNTLIRTSDGGFAFAGSNMWIVKTDANGNEQWNVVLPPRVGYQQSSYDAKSLIETSDGCLALAGQKNLLSTTHGGLYYLVKTTPVSAAKSTSLLPTPRISAKPSVSSVPANLTFPSITIESNGEVVPSNAPLKQKGNVYFFTGDFVGSLAVNRDNIVVDGANFSLVGRGWLDGIYVRASETGVDLSGRSQVIIKNLRVTGFVVGIFLEKSSFTEIAGNIVSECGEGVFVREDSAFNKITNNTIFNNAGRGILVYNSSGNLATRNVISKNQGVSVVSIILGTNNTIAGNIIECNDESAVSINAANNTVVMGNNITGHMTGFEMWSSFDTMVYCNNFVNNTHQVALGEIDRQRIFFDNGTLGNYWSSYVGTDYDGDGIGETLFAPYMFDPYVMDNFPLMTPVDISGSVFDPQMPIIPESSPTIFKPGISATSAPALPEADILLLSVLVAVSLIVAFSGFLITLFSRKRKSSF
jgi:parallel beta-helix repeat protein